MAFIYSAKQNLQCPSRPVGQGAGPYQILSLEKLLLHAFLYIPRPYRYIYQLKLILQSSSTLSDYRPVPSFIRLLTFKRLKDNKEKKGLPVRTVN